MFRWPTPAARLEGQRPAIEMKGRQIEWIGIGHLTDADVHGVLVRLDRAACAGRTDVLILHPAHPDGGLRSLPFDPVPRLATLLYAKREAVRLACPDAVEAGDGRYTGAGGG